ncbi:hypothetical protein [Candidatus Nanohalococcus occultus]|uniref:DNA replication initiation complex subunit, GINS15 family n=1 Tax=Candidatus Nanohalococcus occultus TaxID=2978047 RepID=A0ABY8CDN3_9ARCH|nr:DNA replication initiation complex subunit, GINS15 family [Candidatus Nanohaloarchaeota archaeon SVXNc]
MEDAITFSELRKVQKEESRSQQLTDLDDDFMLKVSDYFKQKEEIGAEREYRNAERVFEKIISTREDKIVRTAKINAKSDGGSTPANMLPFENELFRELKTVFSDHRERAEERRGGDTDFDDVEDFEEQTTSERQESTEETEEENIQEAEEVEDGYTKVKITSEVPEFMGTDLESYGPYDEGEEVQIPEDNAEILVNRGSAEMK